MRALIIGVDGDAYEKEKKKNKERKQENRKTAPDSRKQLTLYIDIYSQNVYLSLLLPLSTTSPYIHMQLPYTHQAHLPLSFYFQLAMLLHRLA